MKWDTQLSPREIAALPPPMIDAMGRCRLCLERCDECQCRLGLNERKQKWAVRKS